MNQPLQQIRRHRLGRETERYLLAANYEMLVSCLTRYILQQRESA